MADEYIFSGSLPENASTYVTRDTDNQLYAGLKEGKFCYVLNSRQSGKSSLRVRTMRRLREDGVLCVAIDLSAGGVQDVTPEQWYVDLIDNIIESCDLDIDLEDWWEENKLRSEVTRFRKFIEEVLLVEIRENIVIFIDEIDSVLSLKFPTDDFFAFIRACHNQRVDNPEYNRLTFCLLGVASPSNLIADKRRTPFNVGTAITLRGFQLHEVEPLRNGLEGKLPNPQSVMQEILNWTGGQPFLTQKLCQFMVEESKQQNPRSVEQLAKEKIIDYWESQDEPEHLRTIRDRILRDEERAAYLLELYQQIILDSGVTNNDSMEQSELMLSGLVVKQQEKLQVYSKIYQEVFNQIWIENELKKLRPYSEAFRAWVASGCTDESRLLRGNALKDAEDWGTDKSLSYQDRQFLAASKEKEIQEEIASQEIAAKLEREQKDKEAAEQRNQVLSEANRRAKQRISIGSFVLAITLSLTGILAILAVSTGKEVVENNEYLKEVGKLSKLAGQLKDEGSDTEAKELFSQASQAVNIPDHNLKLQLLYAGIAYANLRLGENKYKYKDDAKGKENLQEAEKYRDKINLNNLHKKDYSLENSQISILSLRTKAILDKQQNNIQEAINNYQQAFKIFEEIKSDKKNTKIKISPAFNQSIPVNKKLLSKENIEALHKEFLELLAKSTDNNLKQQIKDSLKNHYYDELESLLRNQKWLEADQKTASLMVYIARIQKEKEGQNYLDTEDIKVFSCPDLRQINKQWLDASGNRFGFSVQKSIYLKTNNKLAKDEKKLEKLYNEKTYLDFLNSVGWYDGKSFRNRDEIYVNARRYITTGDFGYTTVLPISTYYLGRGISLLPTYYTITNFYSLVLSRCDLSSVTYKRHSPL
jgi:AAA-like domain/GUN4-like